MQRASGAPSLRARSLYRAGDRSSDFFVVLSGLVAGIDGFGTADERELGVFGERRFGGELGLITGQPAVLTGVVREAGEAIVLSRDALKDVIAAAPAARRSARSTRSSPAARS